ncbi:SDR family NAD(P)-dependent oxidoreductase, partial [Clostridium perfringens]
MEKSWLSLENKTVLVTGGASGIGKSVAQEFLNVGANVVVCDLNPNKPEFQIEENSGKMLYANMNVTDKESISSAVQKAKETFGSIDVLVN